ncbi:MAG: JAB domain-containing protein [Candidatus Humimicrobiaceae bacterium]
MYQYKIALLKNKISEEEVKFKCSQDVAENSFIHSLFTANDNDKEKLYVIILNIKNKIIGYSLVSMGSLTSSIVHP